MRLVGVLITLLIVGVLILQQMKDRDEDTVTTQPLPTRPDGMPQAPTGAQDMPRYEQQLGNYLEQQKEKEEQRVRDQVD